MLRWKKDWAVRTRQHYGCQFPVPLNLVLSYRRLWKVCGKSVDNLREMGGITRQKKRYVSAFWSSGSILNEFFVTVNNKDARVILAQCLKFIYLRPHMKYWKSLPSESPEWVLNQYPPQAGLWKREESPPNFSATFFFFSHHCWIDNSKNVLFVA